MSLSHRYTVLMRPSKAEVVLYKVWVQWRELFINIMINSHAYTHTGHAQQTDYRLADAA